jgi:hypothetical protein
VASARLARAELVEHLRPLVEEVVGELADLLWTRLEETLQVAMSAALSAVALDLGAGGGDDIEAEPAPSAAAPAPIESPSATPRLAAPARGGSSGRRCTACRQPGHRRPQCPTLTTGPEEERSPRPESSARATSVQASGPVTSPPDVDDVDDDQDDDDTDEPASMPPPAPRAPPRDRYAAIEAAADARRAGVLPEPRSTFDLP